MNRPNKSGDEEGKAFSCSDVQSKDLRQTLVNQSRGTETVTLNRNQVECILQLINQVASITLNAGGNELHASTGPVEHSVPSVALVEPYRVVKDTTAPSTDEETSLEASQDSNKLSPPLLGPIVRVRGRNVSPCSLPGTPIQLPPPESMKRLSDPFTQANLHHVKSNTNLHVDTRDSGRKYSLERNNSDFFSSNIPSTSVPCFRRYQMNQNSDEWEKKRLKMLEYQAMLDEQRLEREQRKKLQMERQKREEELWEKKLKQQQEKIRREFEEEKRKQREREENIERKRQIVIEAIENKSRELQSHKKAAQADTISLMSVDAVITKTSDRARDDSYFGDPIKRTQSMYEVQYNTDGVEDTAPVASKCKQYSDVNVQTDYSLLLTWLFDVKEKKDWEEFFNRQSRTPTTTETATETSDSSVTITVDRQREKTLTTSHTLSASPQISANHSRARASPVNAVWSRSSNASMMSSSSSVSRSQVPFIGPSVMTSNTASGKSRWHSKKTDSTESKSVADLKKRHIENSKDFKVKGVTAIKDTKNSLADGGSYFSLNTMDYFSHGSNYHLSLSPSSPDVSEFICYQTSEACDAFNCNTLQLPRIWDTCAKRNSNNKFHTAIPINDTVIRISSADTGDDRIKSKNKYPRDTLYERKKWQSQENFYLTSINNMNNDDTCFSEDDDTFTF